MNRNRVKILMPTLRNIDLTPPYFHSGKVWDLHQAVGIMGVSQLSAQRRLDAAPAAVTPRPWPLCRSSCQVGRSPARA